MRTGAGRQRAFFMCCSGTQSVFFFGFFFPVLVASFRWGYASGVRVAVVSTLLFTIVGLSTTAVPSFELNRFLLRPIYLLVLGHMMAYWGGFEVVNRRRLTFLKDVAQIERMIHGIRSGVAPGAPSPQDNHVCVRGCAPTGGLESSQTPSGNVALTSKGMVVDPLVSGLDSGT